MKDKEQRKEETVEDRKSKREIKRCKARQSETTTRERERETKKDNDKRC